MSLKSKLEAVIYAAEEPVTLTQLATLFATEALEWKAAQEAGGRQAGGSNPWRTKSQPSVAEGLEYLDLRKEDGTPLTQADFDATPAAEPDETTETQHGEVAVVETAEQAAAEPIAETAVEAATQREPAGADVTPVDAEAEAKREARQRDREVKAVLRQLIDEIIASYAFDDRGVEIREIAGGVSNGDQAGVPRCSADVHQEPEAGDEVVTARSGDARRDRVQAASYRSRSERDSRSGFVRRVWIADGAEADHDGGPQAGHRTTDSVQDDEGVSAAVWPEGCVGASVNGRV